MTRQIDSNGDISVERCLTFGADPVEISVLNRPRFVSARWDGEELVVETRSTVSGDERLLEDRWAIDNDWSGLIVTRVHHFPGGDVR